MDRRLSYQTRVHWTGNRGSGTSSYTAYERSHVVSCDGKPDIAGSSDPLFRGDHKSWSPEDLLVSTISACHMLWYLHLCAEAGVVVTGYRDAAEGTMAEDARGGRFTEVVLRPAVTVADPATVERATALHARAAECCFVASSVNFPVRHEPVVS